MTIGGAVIGTSSNSATNIHFKSNNFTGSSCILTPQNINHGILIDGNTFGNIGQGCTEGRLGVRGFNNKAVNGVVISNNVFTGSGPLTVYKSLGVPTEQ